MIAVVFIWSSNDDCNSNCLAVTIYMRDLLYIARPRLLTDTAILKLALCNFLIFKRGYVA